MRFRNLAVRLTTCGGVVHARRQQPGLAVLCMSGSGQFDLRPFLAKPLSAQNLLNAFHRALALHDSMDVHLEVPAVHTLHTTGVIHDASVDRYITATQSLRD